MTAGLQPHKRFEILCLQTLYLGGPPSAVLTHVGPSARQCSPHAPAVCNSNLVVPSRHRADALTATPQAAAMAPTNGRPICGRARASNCARSLQRVLYALSRVILFATTAYLTDGIGKLRYPADTAHPGCLQLRSGPPNWNNARQSRDPLVTGGVGTWLSMLTCFTTMPNAPRSRILCFNAARLWPAT